MQKHTQMKHRLLFLFLTILFGINDAFDKPIYMMYYTGLDIIPVPYEACMPLILYDQYPASILVMDALSNCTAYSDQTCQTALTSNITVQSGFTNLDDVGPAFSMENFIVCTLDDKTAWTPS